MEQEEPTTTASKEGQLRQEQLLAQQAEPIGPGSASTSKLQSAANADEVVAAGPSSEALVSPTRESSRLKGKAASASKAKQGAAAPAGDPHAEAQQHHQQSGPDMDAVMQAAAAAERMKNAFTINEQELLALRPALLKGFAYMQQQRRDDLVEADLKSLLYYFRHHTVDPTLLKQLCFVEAVYVIQRHPNRLVADLAAQLLHLGPWKIVYEQLRAINEPWFEQHSVANQSVATPGAAPGGAPAAVPAAIATHNKP